MLDLRQLEVDVGPHAFACQSAWRSSAGRGYRAGMATIVLRARLVGGQQHTDLTYEDPEQVDENAIIDQVIQVLSTETGVLRCRHGERLVALFARGVASIEVSPRGAIL